MNPAYDPQQPRKPAPDPSLPQPTLSHEDTEPNPSGAGFSNRPTLAQLVFLANQASAQVSLRTLEAAARLL